MKLRYLSDLHLEFINPNKIDQFIEQIPSGLDEICILAGDIGNPYEDNYDLFMNFISKNFKKSFVIAGNHEYYNKLKDMNETRLFLIDYFTQFDNITFLDNSFEDYEGYCFIGTTLWSRITNPDFFDINDVKSIPKFGHVQYNLENAKSISFLVESLSINKNCIVITHHMPSESLIHIKYKTPSMLPYNQWYYSNLDVLIEQNKDKIKCWFYGHTHIPSHREINGIPFVCNPIGYQGENNKTCFNIKMDL